MTALGLAGIIVTGVFQVFKNGRSNNEIIERQNQIKEEIKATLNKGRE